jgi:hypothetical protein
MIQEYAREHWDCEIHRRERLNLPLKSKTSIFITKTESQWDKERVVEAMVVFGREDSLLP